MKKTAFHIDASELDRYIANLKKKSYKGMIADVTAITRQAANDIKRAYKSFVPKSSKGSGSGKYGFTSGNLERSLGVYRQKQRSTMTVAFSVGFKKHRYGELAGKLSKGKKASDGYYGAWVDAGVAGRGKNTKKSGGNRSKGSGFRERARNRVNIVMSQGISQRGMKVLKRRLEKDLLANK